MARRLTALGADYAAYVRRVNGLQNVTVYNPGGIAIGLIELPNAEATRADAVREAREFIGQVQP